MAIASGARYALRYIAEVTHGVTPTTPVMKALRFLAGPGLDLKKDIYQSKEVRQDRMISNVRHGMRKVDGTINFEMSLATFDDFMLAAISGAWTTPTSGAISLSTTATDVVGTSGWANMFFVGDLVTLTGFTQGSTNGKWKIQALTLTNMTLCNPTTGVVAALTSEVSAAGKTVALTGHIANVGTTLTTFTIEEAYTDISQYYPYRGCAINTMDLSIKPGAIVTGSFGLLGIDLTAPSGTTIASSVTAPVTNAPMDSYIGGIWEGGVNLALITGMDLKLNNNRAVQGIVGSKVTQDIYEGQSDVTGKVTVLFQDLTLYNKFLNETVTSLDVLLNDANGTDFLRFYVPAAKYTGAPINPPKDGPVIMTLPFTATVDAVTGTTFRIQRSN